jgi:hypothetical protein
MTITYQCVVLNGQSHKRLPLDAKGIA